MKIYMVGIGGIGMSALAQLYAHGGHTVFGSDREVSPTTALLESKGIAVLIGQKAENVPADADLLVYSDAIPTTNSERVRGHELGIKELSYFEALGEVSKNKKTIAVAGTHGKTTTTGMLAKILIDAGAKPTVIVGSITKDFGSNFVAGDSNIFVVEACEYQDHLLDLSPSILVITNLEWDHTDFFPSLAALQETFRVAVSKVPKDGLIVTNPSDPNIAPVLLGAQATILDYTKEQAPELSLIGEFNKMNARAAKATTKALISVGEEEINTSLADFKGTWRRFEYKGETDSGATVYDDYAHHPTAVRETIRAVHERFPEKKIIVAFHPHLYSRTRDLMEEFTRAFDEADHVLLAPIYAAREESIEGVSSTVLAEKINAKKSGLAEAMPSLEAVFLALEKLAGPDTIIVTMGAGDIYKVANKLVLP